MIVARDHLVDYCNILLDANNISDYAPNGLQVEGKAEIEHIITGVTACQALIDQAIAEKADAILVHHGYFWKGEALPITGMKQRRIKALLAHDINLLGYHLPLDMHEHLGNNAQLAYQLHFKATGTVASQPPGLIWQGMLEKPMSLADFATHVCKHLGRRPLTIEAGDHPIETIAWCTGGAQNYIESAARSGVDAYLSGEISEQTVHAARELGVHYIAAGHHATERYGIEALGQHLSEQFAVKVTFVDIDNPA